MGFLPQLRETHEQDWGGHSEIGLVAIKTDENVEAIYFSFHPVKVQISTLPR